MQQLSPTLPEPVARPLPPVFRVVVPTRTTRTMPNLNLPCAHLVRRVFCMADGARSSEQIAVALGGVDHHEVRCVLGLLCLRGDVKLMGMDGAPVRCNPRLLAHSYMEVRPVKDVFARALLAVLSLRGILILPDTEAHYTFLLSWVDYLIRHLELSDDFPVLLVRWGTAYATHVSTLDLDGMVSCFLAALAQVMVKHPWEQEVLLTWRDTLLLVSDCLNLGAQ